MKITFFVYISALFFLVTGWKLLCTGKLGYAGAVSAMKRQLFTRSRRKKAEAGIRVWMRRIPFFEHRRRAKIDAEISEGISFLRNLTVIGEGRRLSADSVNWRIEGECCRLCMERCCGFCGKIREERQ